MPGGAPGPATNLRRYLPRSTAMGPLTLTSCVCKENSHLPHFTACRQNCRMASRPISGGLFGGICQASSANIDATESISPEAYHRSALELWRSMMLRISLGSCEGKDAQADMARQNHNTALRIRPPFLRCYSCGTVPPALRIISRSCGQPLHRRPCGGCGRFCRPQSHTGPNEFRWPACAPQQLFQARSERDILHRGGHLADPFGEMLRVLTDAIEK